MRNILKYVLLSLSNFFVSLVCDTEGGWNYRSGDNSRCFKLFSDAVTHSGATQVCEEQGAQIFAPKSEEDNLLLMEPR